MRKFILNRILSLIELGALASFASGPAHARLAAAMPDYCRGAKPTRELSMFYSARISRPAPGTPLDVALRLEQEETEKLRNEARGAFRTQPPDPMAWAMENYTFLTPESEKQAYGLGDLVAMSEISLALKYRTLLWRSFFEHFTRVKEAPSNDPEVVRFEVSLDLSYYCRYRRRVQDLVTH